MVSTYQYDNYSIKIFCNFFVKFDVLVVQNGVVVVQSDGKERQKSVVHVQICFFAS